MPKVLITTRVISWSAIALAMSSCSPNPESISTSENTNHTQQNTAAAPMAIVEQTASIPALSTAPASTLATTPAIKLAVATQAPIPVPYVNPLNSIAIVAQKRNSDPAKSTQGNISARPQRYPNSNKSAPPICKAFPCLILTQAPSHPQNTFNNPIYKLTAYQSKIASSFQLDAVTGRGFTQTRNRYQSETEAPLPDGSYSVSPRVVLGTIAEVGGTMIPIFPKSGFDRRMGRSALGIHWDPSFNKDKKEDGTSGCIGLTTKKDYHRVRDFILKYRPRSLEVQIDR